MLNLNAQFRFNADTHNIIVEECKTFTKKDGTREKRWIEVAYFSRLGAALDYVVQRNVRAGIPEGTKKLNERIQKLEREVSRFKATYRDLYEYEK